MPKKISKKNNIKYIIEDLRQHAKRINQVIISEINGEIIRITPSGKIYKNLNLDKYIKKKYKDIKLNGFLKSKNEKSI